MSNALPEPLAEGDLARTPFAHLLLTLHGKGLTGTLVVWDPSGEEGRQQDRIHFQGGRPSAGRLLERASRLDRGMLPLFAREAGPFAFYEDVDLVGESEHVRTGCIDTPALIAASLRGSSRDDAVEHIVGGLGDVTLRFVSGADLSPFGLLPDEETTLELLRAEPSSAERLAQMSPLPERAARRLVYLCMITKLIEPWDGVTKTPVVAPLPEKPRPSKSDASTAPNDTPPPPPERLAEKHQVLWDDILKRAAAIESENYYEMLGVPRDAASGAIETAYYGLVKKWHPDRIPAEVVELRGTVEQIFQYLTRAQETLCDDDKRGLYLAAVQEGGGTPEAERELSLIVQAAMDFRKVEVLARRRDYAGALEILEAILEAAPEEAQYLATRAELRFKLDPSSLVLVRADLERALAVSDDLDGAHHTLGLILKKEGDAEGALVHFEKAATLNPRNIDAAREVRLAQMRGPTKKSKRGSKAAGDSFFGKLFKSGKKK